MLTRSLVIWHSGRIESATVASAASCHPGASWRERRKVDLTLIIAAHGLLFTVLVCWSWLKWPDPVIDFGRELYVPWQITRGKVLFRDIESLFGPLSPYVNALWFRLFGVSLLTLVGVNLVILAAVIAGIHRLVHVATDRFTATTASLVALTLFGCLQLGTVGNYNFVTPYAHEAIHGIALGVAVLVALHGALSSSRVALGAVAGLAFGSLLLTKPETSLAAAAAAGVAIVGAGTMVGARRFLRSLVLLFTLAALVPPLLFFAYFRQYMDAGSSLRAIARGWTTALEGSITGNTFYVSGMGLDRPASNALAMAVIFGAFLVYVAAMVVVCRASPAPFLSPTVRKVGRLAVLVVAPVAVLFGFPRALPLITAAAALVAGVTFYLHRQHAAAMRYLVLVMWCTYALVLLAKLGLHARFHHYGFYLALPAATVLVIVLCWLVPRGLEAETAKTFRRVAVMVLAAGLAPYIGASNAAYRTKTVSVGAGSDRFLASHTTRYWQGASVRDVLRTIESLRQPGDTLAVLPEGVMLNYLARLDSPLRVVNVMPPEFLAFGEDEILRALRAAPPRFILLVYKDMAEYGYPVFGTEPYGRRTHEWIRAGYRTLDTFGADPVTGHGIELLERQGGWTDGHTIDRIGERKG